MHTSNVSGFSPYPPTPGHENGETSKEHPVLSSAAQHALQPISGLTGIWHWQSCTRGWFADLNQNGGLQFLRKIMTLPSGEGYYPARWVPIAHRLNLVVFTDTRYWRPLFGKQKGKQVCGGVELRKLGKEEVLTDRTPLTVDNDAKGHRKIKRACMNGTFGLPMVQYNTPGTYRAAKNYLQFLFDREEYVEMSREIPQMVSRMNVLALLAPLGSKASKTIHPLLFHEDGSPNTAWNILPEAVDYIGQGVSDDMFYNPLYHIRNFYHDLNHFTEDMYDNGSCEPKYESNLEKSQRILRETMDLLIEKSRECLGLEYEAATFHGRKVQGQIEKMLTEEREYEPSDLMGMARLILVISQRTTSVAIEACIRLLVLHPEWQTILRAEITETLDEEGVTHEALGKMDQLNRFVLEALRLYPPVPIQTRETNRELEYQGLKLPKGTTMMTAHFLVQRNPRIFSDPDTFDPGRFDAEHSINEMHTFSRAPHNCAGKQQALAAIKTSLIALLRKGTIVAKNLSEVKKASPVGGFVLRFNSPLYLRIESHLE